MAILRVDCITPEGADDHVRIEALGGEGFHHSAEVAILNIRSNVHTYYMMVDGEVALIDVANEPVSGRPYLQIVARRYSSRDFSALPACDRPDSAEGEGAQGKGRPRSAVLRGRS